MFNVNPMPKQIDPELISRMERVETATIGHFLHSGFLDRDLRAVLPEKRVGGTAVTVRLPHADSTILHYLTKMVRPGDFILVDRCGDSKHACWGGVVTHAMKLGGIVGAAIDGPATDFSEIRRVELPMWCRGPAPITTKILGLEGAINVPVSIGGQMVNPGDAVIADESGVVILPPEQAAWAVDKALAMQEAELVLLERLRQGEKLPDISGATKLVEA